MGLGPLAPAGGTSTAEMSLPIFPGHARVWASRFLVPSSPEVASSVCPAGGLGPAGFQAVPSDGRPVVPSWSTWSWEGSTALTCAAIWTRSQKTCLFDHKLHQG